MKKWKYDIRTYVWEKGDETFKAWLDRHGRDGWEAVAIHRFNEADREVTFKKETH